MSAADVRKALAEAATTVQGIDVAPYFVQTQTPGHGMVRMDRVDYPNPFGGLTTWQVLLVLDQDIAAGEQFLQDIVPDVVDAVREHIAVRNVVVQDLVLDVGRVPVVVITGQREEE